MSAELFNNTPEAIEPAAASYFNEARSYYASLPEFLTKIAKDYKQTFNGKAELLQAMRIAQFLTHNQPGTFYGDTEAVYNGQLIGLQVINYENPVEAPVGNMANTFMKSLLLISENQVADNLKDPSKNVFGVQNETPESQQSRLYLAAENAIKKLSTPDTAYEKTHSFEPFIESLVSELYGDNQELGELAKIGFRLTLQQHEYSSAGSQTKQLVKEVDETDEFDETEYAEPSKNELLAIDSELAAIEKAETQLAIKALEKITSIRNRDLAIEEYFPIVNADPIAKAFYNKFNNLRKSGPKLPFAATEKEEDAYRGYFDDELGSYNIENILIQQGDLLFVTGNFIGIVAVESEEEHEGKLVTVHKEDYAKFGSHVEIRGEFEGVYVNSAPNLRELEKVIKDDRATKISGNSNGNGEPYESDSEVLTAVIRVTNPTFISYADEKSEPIKEYGTGMRIAIPLIYNKHVSYQVLKADDPKKESML